jgi:hypothetical protein
MEVAMTISPSDIQKELSRIWDSVEGSNKMRASLFNLIFYTQKTSRDVYLHRVAQKVLEKFPCRIIFISVDPNVSDNYLKANVSLMYAGKDSSSIACDLIELEVAGDQHRRIPFVILPHILPDLPIYLVWEKDPCEENPILSQMTAYAARLIFDSESANDLPQFAGKLLQFYRESRVDVADLNWARMENWRDLFTTHFYSLENLAKLQKVNKISIFYNSHESASFCHTRIQATYLQAWLKCQLEWEFKQMRREGNLLIFVYGKKDGEVVITLTPEDHPHLAPGTITGVDLATTHDHEFSFSRHKEVPNHIVIKVGSPQKCEVPTHYIFAKGESGQSLVKEICHRGTSEHYLKILNHISQMESVC